MNSTELNNEDYKQLLTQTRHITWYFSVYFIPHCARSKDVNMLPVILGDPSSHDYNGLFTAIEAHVGSFPR